MFVNLSPGRSQCSECLLAGQPHHTAGCFQKKEYVILNIELYRDLFLWLFFPNKVNKKPKQKKENSTMPSSVKEFLLSGTLMVAATKKNNNNQEERNTNDIHLECVDFKCLKSKHHIPTNRPADIGSKCNAMKIGEDHHYKCRTCEVIVCLKCNNYYHTQHSVWLLHFHDKWKYIRCQILKLQAIVRRK